MLGMQIIAYVFTPLLTLSLLYEYHMTDGKDQTPYFIFSFCLLGDLIVMSDDFYYFISALMAYWGASILYYFTLHRALDKPLGELLKKWKNLLPFLIYGSYFVLIMSYIRPSLKELFVPIAIYAATLSFIAPLSIVVYFQQKSHSMAYFSIGLILLSIMATLIGLNRFLLKSDVLKGLITLFYSPTLFLIFLYFKTNSNDEL